MKLLSPRSRVAWFVVAAVGVIVAAVVFILGLMPRLSAADKLLNGLEPVFTADRVAGAQAGVAIVSDITDLGDPIMTNSGTAAAEVPKLIAFVSQKSGLPPDAVNAALAKNVPHLNDLLLSLPFSDVTAELPQFISFLSGTLKMPPDAVHAAINQNFPGLAQVIASLPKVTTGWDKVPGTEKLTRFNGTPVTDVPSVRDYFAQDVVPVLQTQRQNFGNLNALPGGPNFIPPLLLVLGIVVAIFGLVMAFLSPKTRGAPTGWAVVTVVGVVVIVLVTGILGLFSRLGAGQKVLDAAAPAFTQARVQGHIAAIAIVSDITDLADPIATNSGTAASEVPKLIAFVSQGSTLPPDAVKSALMDNVPKLTNLLLSLPLSAVTNELPTFNSFLSATLKMPPDAVNAAINQNFPGLAQVIASLPKVTNGWDKVPGTENLTRLNGTPITDVPSVRDFFAIDVIPTVQTQQQNFADVANPFPRLTVFAPLLLAVGILVTVYGAAMFVLAFLGRKRSSSA